MFDVNGRPLNITSLYTFANGYLVISSHGITVHRGGSSRNTYRFETQPIGYTQRYNNTNLSKTFGYATSENVRDRMRQWEIPGGAAFVADAENDAGKNGFRR